jgi:hypothetical protein
MQMQIMSFVHANLNDHYVLEAKQIFQIADEDALSDENAYANKILLHLDLIRVE